jgi:hypothetical protein
MVNCKSAFRQGEIWKNRFAFFHAIPGPYQVRGKLQTEIQQTDWTPVFTSPLAGLTNIIIKFKVSYQINTLNLMILNGK